MLLYLLIIVFIGLSVGLVSFLLKNDKGGEEKPVAALWMAAAFGLIAAMLAALLEKELIPINNLKVGASLSTMLYSFLGVGIIEESLKFIPLAIAIYPRRFFNRHTDGIIYFAIAGLGFGLPENILYTVQYGTKAGLGRLILTPFFHAALTAMIGYYLARAKLAKKNPLTIWPLFVLAILLHGVYDFGLTEGTDIFTFISVTITLALSVNLFNLFFKAKDLDEDQGLAIVGHNNYCRTCGHVNSHHHLYCTYCGNRA